MKGGKIQYRVWRDKKETRRERRRLIDDIKVFGEIDDPRWPDPTPEMLSSPEFEAVWQCIKLWDINVPDAYVGYCGSNGNHVRAILDALRALPTTDLEKELLAALKNLIDHSGHMSPFGGDGATVKTMRNAMK